MPPSTERARVQVPNAASASALHEKARFKGDHHASSESGRVLAAKGGRSVTVAAEPALNKARAEPA